MSALQIGTALNQMRDCLSCPEPDPAVFELGAHWSASLTALLNHQPEIRLAGLVPCTYRLVVLASRHYWTDAMKDLPKVILQQTEQQARSLEGG